MPRVLGLPATMALPVPQAVGCSFWTQMTLSKEHISSGYWVRLWRLRPRRFLPVGISGLQTMEPDVFSPIPPVGPGRSHQELLDFAIAFAPWGLHAAIVSRDILSGQLLWDEKDFYGEDTAFWFRLLCFHQPKFCDHRGALYRYQSIDRRTNHQSAAWCRGHHVQVLENVAFLKRNRLAITSGQCDNLMRIYLNLFECAVKCGDTETVTWTIKEANIWLNNYFKCPGSHTLKMRIRKYVGPARLQTWLNYWRSK